MIIVMKQNATQDSINNIINEIHNNGLEAHISNGMEVTIIGVIGDKSKLRISDLKAYPEVEKVLNVTDSRLKVGFAGLGLIGGSLARTIKRIYPNARIIAADIDTKSLTIAKNEEIIEKIVSLDEIFEYSTLNSLDYLFLCAPVITNIKNLEKISKNIKDAEVIISDVGSVKSEVVKKAKELNLTQFIGGHPMAGSEKTGFESSNDHLLENVYYIIANDVASDENVDKFRDFIKSLGSIPVIMDGEYHDYVMAGISHVPHFIASALVNTVKDASNNDEMFKKLAAGGFKDITRIASSSPDMWEQIALSNTANIIKVLDIYINQLKDIKENIISKDGNNIHDFFDEAREYRDSVPNSGIGGINNQYSFHCDLADEAGAIATVATILAMNGINIKNIGIVHNREYMDGALRIEFYDEESKNTSISLLENKNYKVYR